MNKTKLQSSIAKAGTLCLLLWGGLLVAQSQTTIVGEGQFNFKYEGVLLPDQWKPNVSGPFVSRALDLDSGKALPRTTADLDLTLVMDIRTATFSVSPGKEQTIAASGKDRPSSAACRELLEKRGAKTGLSAGKAPTPYFCSRTSAGNLATFRILRWREEHKPGAENFVDLTITIDRIVWGQ